MDDTSKLIIQAIKKGSIEKKKSKVIKDIEKIEPICAIETISNKKIKTKKTFKNKSIKSWNSKDFLKYIEDSLKFRGFSFKDNTILGGNQVSKLYDLFVEKIPDLMNNDILRDYIDWWMAYKASKLDDTPVSIYEISSEKLICDFISYKGYNTLKQSEPVAVKTREDVNLEEAYKYGGLEFALRSAGIVETCFYIKNLNSNYLLDVSNCLKKIGKNAFSEVMNITLQRGIYSREYLIDFVSVARPAIVYYGMKEYEKLQYTKFFQS